MIYQETKLEIMSIEQISYIPQLVQKVFAFFWEKLVIGLLAVPVIFFNQAQHKAMVALLLLIIFDFLSAILVAKKNGEQIESAKIFRTALKVMVYFVMVSAGHLTNVAIGVSLYLDTVLIGFLAVTELISILENFGKAGYAVPQQLLNQLYEYKNRRNGEDRRDGEDRRNN